MTPRTDFILDYFGGRSANRDFLHTSNIIFSNGALDPWMPGGVIHNATAGWSSIAIYIEDAAHHLDLRLPNDEFDPQTVKDARKLETELIKECIDNYNKA